MAAGGVRFDNWGTPIWLFRRLDEEFGPFDLDAAAEPWSACCTRYFTAEDDALRQEWAGRVWLNPPYAKEVLTKFLVKSIEHARGGGLVVALLPVRTEMDWWHDLVLREASEVRFIRGRIAFRTPPGRPRSHRPGFSSCIAVFGSCTDLRVTSLSAPQNSRRLTTESLPHQAEATGEPIQRRLT